jgi:predicted phosphodiesterase
VKLLCAADLHLGRVPARLPADLPLDGAALGPAAAWRALVAQALRERPAALLLAGDVVDDPRDAYEAYADLAAGIEALHGDGVPVLAVAGNHDVEVLPRLADELPGLRLLGRGGRWEAAALDRHGATVRVVGWSFPRPQVTASPLSGGLAEALRDLPPGRTIGLLHADLDASGSHYAPVRRAELDGAPVDAWLLGHVHVPSALAAPRPTGYLGALSPADPGEPGAHGAWRLTLTDGDPQVERVAVAPLRYDTVEVSLDGLGRPGEALAHVVAALRSHGSRVADGALRAASVRLLLTGRVDRPDAVRRALLDEDPRHARVEVDGVHVAVEAWEAHLRPPVDLAALARSDDPVGIAARALLTLREGDLAARAALVDAGRGRLAEVDRRGPFAALAPNERTDGDVAARLERAAERVLATLLAQREGEAP